MERAALRQRLSAILESVTNNPSSGLDDSSSLHNDLGLDSVEVVQRVQNKLGVELSSNDLEQWRTIGDLLEPRKDSP